MEPHTTMKVEIKEEDLDDINPECLLTVHKLDLDLAGLEHDLQTETQPPSSPTLSCKEKSEHIAEEKEENHDSDFPTTSKTYEHLFSVVYICYIINNNR